MDNPEDNYQFEFHAKAPTNDKGHFWFKVGDILELGSGVLDYVTKHHLEKNELDLLDNLKYAFHDK